MAAAVLQQQGRSPRGDLQPSCWRCRSCSWRSRRARSSSRCRRASRTPSARSRASSTTRPAGVASIFRTIAEIDTLRQENASLDEENDRLRIENARLEETQRENDLLTGLLQLQAGLDHKTVAASVIAREPAEFRRAVTLDRGSDQGIEQGDVVIGAGGALVGRVVEVGPNYSNVTLLTDGPRPSSGSSCRTPPPGRSWAIWPAP